MLKQVFCSIIMKKIKKRGMEAMRSIWTNCDRVTIMVSGEPVPGRAEVLSLVRRALAEEGFPPWQEVRADCYCAGEDTLVLARPGERRRPAFYFRDEESLLACARSVPAEGGVLFAVPEGFVLTMEPGQTVEGLYEFGEALRLHPLWETAAAERDFCLFPEKAMEKLREDMENVPPLRTGQ